jgi:dGTPase
LAEPAYLELDPAIERAIKQDMEAGRLHPNRTPDSACKRREDKPHDRATLMRPAFARDAEKIINIPAYNRYAGKTQVFSFIDNDDICRRGLHVQLVSRIACNIGRMLGLNGDLIEAIALGHDLGHTPFGHAGERFLSKCYHGHTGRYFNHNVHSVRVMDALYPRNISLQVLDGALCHNGEFAAQELACSGLSTFDELDAQVEACNADEGVIGTLRPATLEGCVVRVADMIAYLGKDRADAMLIGVVDSLDVFDTKVIGRDNVHILNNIMVDIVNNSYGRDRIAMSEAAFEDVKLAKRQNYQLIYDKEGWRAGGENVVERMFGRMYEQLLADLLADNEESAIFAHHANKLAMHARSLTAESYIDGTEPNQVVVDFMASMTNRYFLSLHRHLFPDSPDNVSARDYCASLKDMK